MRNFAAITRKKLKTGLIAVLMVLVMGGSVYTVFKPRPAEAQCVCGMLCTLAGTGIGRAIDTVMSSRIVVEIYNTYTTLSTLYNGLTTEFNAIISGSMLQADNNLNEWLDAFLVYDLTPAMQDWTAQINTMIVDQTRATNSMIDGQQHAKTVRTIQDMEADVLLERAPNISACVAGSFGGGLTRARTISSALQRAMPLQGLGAGGNYFPVSYLDEAEELGRLFGNAQMFTAQFLHRGGQYCAEFYVDINEDDYLAAAAGGNALYQKARAHNYLNKYCNSESNDGNGCIGGTEGALKDYDILVDQTLFMDDTIDYEIPDRLDAVNDLVTNLIEPEVPPLIAPSTFGLPSTQEEILNRRSFRAQKILAKKAVYDVAARRAPGSRIGPYVETLRRAAGVDLAEISENPSLNEVINALTTERFWTGVYNIQNVQGPAQVNHEKLTVQAVELMQMSDYLDMLNNLSMLLASQVATETIELGDAGGIDSAPVSGSE